MKDSAIKWWNELSDSEKAIYCDEFTTGQFHHDELEEETIILLYQFINE